MQIIGGTEESEVSRVKEKAMEPITLKEKKKKKDIAVLGIQS